MTSVRRVIDVPYPQEEVFDFVADLRNERLWHPELESVEQTSDGPVGIGTTFAAKYGRIGSVTVTIEEYQRPWHLVFQVTGRTSAEYDHRLSAQGGETRVETVATTRLRGLAWLLYPLLRGRITRQFQERGELLVKGLAAVRHP